MNLSVVAGPAQPLCVAAELFEGQVDSEGLASVCD